MLLNGIFTFPTPCQQFQSTEDVILSYLLNVLLVRIFPLCVPSLSQSAEHRLLQLVHCYVSASSADIMVDEGDDVVYDVCSLEDADVRDDGRDVERSIQLSQGRWTVDNGLWFNSFLNANTGFWHT